jgi:hypothetical protein
MARLYINPTLERQIRQYCQLNDIEDVNAFANRCANQGFNIIKFGTSPKDNFERETKGIKDIKKTNGKKETHNEAVERQPSVKREEPTTSEKEESKPTEERKEGVTIRKIQIIKKQ